jgi:hypothetical protein
VEAKVNINFMTRKSVRVLFFLFGGVVIFFALCSYLQTRTKQSKPYNQIRIPLDNQKGVPFRKVYNDEYLVQGFDIDSNENYYFLGGDKATLSCFSKEGKSVYRKSFPGLFPGQVYIWGEKLYFLEIGPTSSYTLVEINRIDGSINHRYSKTIKSVLASYGCVQEASYDFRDSILHITCLDSQGIEKANPKCFNLKGKLLPGCDQYTLSNAAIENDPDYVYLGRFGNNYVLRKFSDDSKRYDLSLRDSSNAVIADTFIVRKVLTESILGDEGFVLPEHIKIKNNKLYTLHREKNVAVVTSIDLATLFHAR